MNSNERVKRYRERKRALQSVTLPGVEGVTQDEPLHPKALHNGTVTLYRYIDGKRQELKEVPEGFKVLSDGQVWKPLGITSQVKAKIKLEGTDKVTAAKLLIICQSLNKFDVAQEVRYGAFGPTMDIVSERLGAS